MDKRSANQEREDGERGLDLFSAYERRRDTLGLVAGHQAAVGDGEKLTTNQAVFAAYYDGDARSTVAKMADDGYALTAGVANSYLKLPHVRKALRSLPAPTGIADKDERLQFLTSVMRGEVKTESVDKDGNIFDQAPSVNDRLKACEMLGKVFCDFTNKSEVDVKISLAAFLERVDVAKLAN